MKSKEATVAREKKSLRTIWVHAPNDGSHCDQCGRKKTKRFRTPSGLYLCTDRDGCFLFQLKKIAKALKRLKALDA